MKSAQQNETGRSMTDPSAPVCPECRVTGILDYQHQEFYCPKCGLVLGQNYPLPKFTKPLLGKATEKTNTRIAIKYNLKQKLRARLAEKTPTTVIMTEDIARKLSLPDYTVEHAKKLAKKALDSKLHGARIAAACVLAACRTYTIPRAIKEIEEKSGVEEKKILTALKNLQKKLKIRTEPIKAEEWVHVYAAKLNLRGEVIKKALETARKLEETCNARPATIAAAAIYKHSKIRLKTLCEISGVSHPSILKCASLLSNPEDENESC
jgi:transcription initiation factor TFIIIB Brf1 subunit/transcription initiation factor TFIIB